jgi:hypothetical protein
MAQVVTLNNRAHRHIAVDTDRVEALGAEERMIPVVLSEFSKLIVQYPILLTKNAATGQFVCVALLGFEQGENLFWNGTGWDGIYTPLNITRQPFFVGTDEQDGNAHLICLDTESPCLSSDRDKGESLFDGEGRETDFLTGIKQTLAGLIESENETRQFVEALAMHDLVVPLSLDITFANNDSRKLQGIYSIDEDKLEQMSSAVRDEFFARGYLKPIYTMIASLGHIYGLIQRKNQRLEMA